VQRTYPKDKPRRHEDTEPDASHAALGRQRVIKNGRNTNADSPPFAFLAFLLTRVSAGMPADVRRVDVGACAPALGPCG